MTVKFLARLGASSLAIAVATHAAHAQTADTTIIELKPLIIEADGTDTRSLSPGMSLMDPRGAMSRPAADGADLLRRVPGVDAGRFGGHGLEIVIRGQQQNQINVIDAGAFTYGGCPNRMDPPLSSARLSLADRIIVQRGYASVTNGPGATGGAVILERDPPQLDDDKRLSGHVSTGLTSNSNTLNASGQLTYNLGNGFYVRGSIDKNTADNYTDGSGNTVRTSYEQTGWGLTLGYVRNGVDLAFDVESNEVDDALFPGAGMDSPYSDNMLYRLRGGVDLDAGALRRIEGNLFLSEVDHLMDNFTLRPPGMMAARVPSTSDTWGGKLEAQFEFASTRATIGIDIQTNDREATFYSGPFPAFAPNVLAEDPALARFFMWPDVSIRQTGLYAEAETDLSESTMIKYGLRYDRVRASAGKADEVPGGSAQSPNFFYTREYGTDFNSARTENNIGGLIRLEHGLTTDSKVFVGVSRAVRTADAVERATARVNWVGNPDIDPEKHHQLDIGYQLDRGDLYFSAAVYYDRVEDYILRDQFTVPGVTTYRNVDADLAGVELAAAWQRGGWQLSGDMTYTRGRNRSDNRDLAQIPPLQGKVEASYGMDGWHTGARVNWAADQDDIDPARDPGTTSGWATLDLFGSYAITERVAVTAGVDNVTDETYARHLSRSDLINPALVQVNEPGRTMYVSVSASF